MAGYHGDMEPRTVLTIGHSNRALEEFIELLQVHGVDCVVDVRTVPRSRRNPQFNRDSLPGSLAECGVRYLHLPDLGGLRRPRPDSPNGGWENESFRGFADYMLTPEFEAGLERVLELRLQGRPALMCAEAVPWRCHRSLIADALTARGVPVEHIVGRGRRRAHRLTPFARLVDGRLVYPPDETLEDSRPS